MKNLFLLAILMTVSSNIFAMVNQGNWRWRKDDGSETTATWMDAQNTATIITNGSDLLRLRIEFHTDMSVNLFFNVANTVLQVSTDQLTWDTIKLTADVSQPFILAGSSVNVTDMQATTQQLSSPHAATFIAGQEIVSSEKLSSYSLNIGNGTEFEYVIKPTVNIQPSATYYFRITPADHQSGVVLPSLTTAIVLSVRLADFTIKKDGKKVRLNWTTTSEQNNDRFELQRSADAMAWNTIAEIKGSGTSNEVHAYNCYDERPLNGTGYYRLKQYDFDGHYTLSEVKSLKFDGRVNSVISVSPNPVTGAVNFKLENSSASNVFVSLISADGSYVHREIMNTVDAGKVYRLNLLKQPVPGLYILNIRAKGLMESIKVVIQ